MKSVTDIADVADVPNVRAGQGRPSASEAARKFAGWCKQVGAARASEARAVSVLPGREKFTFIELLTEAYLLKRGVRYQTQVELGIGRPDFVALDAPDIGQALVIAVQGERWHEGRQYHDAGKMLAMCGVAAQGVPICRSVQVWERDVLAGEQVVEDALRGVSWRSV